jgi:Beta propeller domain
VRVICARNGGFWLRVLSETPLDHRLRVAPRLLGCYAKASMTRLVLVLAAALLPVACMHVTPGAPGTLATNRGAYLKNPDGSERSLNAFGSLQQLQELMASVGNSRRIAQQKELASLRAECRKWAKSDADVRACSTMELSAGETVTVSSGRVDSITNNQHAGVDEGDIVKRVGEVLIVLRRGRLFTIGIGGGQLDSLAVADAFGPDADGVEADATWYDELLVWQRTVIVVGYSYERGGTEIGLFDLGEDGELRHRATYHLRSDDYYSTSNYASRLIGDRLVIFTSLRLPENVDPNAWLPALRRWDPRGSNRSFETIAPISRVFQPVAPLGEYPTIHALTVCTLAALSFECEANVVLGDGLTAYYASPTAVYAWTTAWDENRPSRSILYRMPFDGAPVSAVGVVGRPPDQLAFFEDAHDHLNVVVAHENDAVTLLRLPLSSFSDGSIDAPTWFYRPIARGGALIARFVGSYVLVGTPTFDADAKGGRRVVVTALEGTSTISLKLPHALERIEPMGAHAVIVGTDHDSLVMTAIRLGVRATVAGTLVHPDASQSEYRSHGFFYRQDGPDDGVFGLPIATTRGDSEDGWDRPARILFIRNRGLTLATAGTLDPSPTTAVDDSCRASCIDWYGTARPIFIEERLFALSGYAMVEGRLVDGRVERAGRLDFMPRIPPVPRP